MPFELSLGPAIRVVILVGFASVVASCTLFDDPQSVGLADVGDPPNGSAGDAGDPGATDTSGSDTSSVPDVADVAVADTPVADVSGDLPDVGVDLGNVSVDNFFDRIAEETCNYYERENYHGLVFAGFVGFHDIEGCRRLFEIAFRPLFALLARDVDMNRAVPNEDVALGVLEELRTRSGDPRLAPIPDLSEIAAPLQGEGDPCATNSACQNSLDGLQMSCARADVRACDGQCFRQGWAFCGSVVCTSRERCSEGVCVDLVDDGEPCMAEAECLNHCLSSGFCGVVAAGDDCSADPDACQDGYFCDDSTCNPFKIDDEPCTTDEECLGLLRCDLDVGSCQPVEADDPCLNGECPEGLNCVAKDDGLAPVCVPPRPAGEWCGDESSQPSDAFCEPGTYCSASNRCVEVKGNGTNCRTNRECLSGTCEYMAPPPDDPSGTCVDFEWGLGEGAACNTTSSACGLGLECVTNASTNAGTCEPLVRPGLGESCDEQFPFWCADGTRCIGGTCIEMVGVDEPCDSDAVCRTGVCAAAAAVMGKTCFDRVGTCLP